MVFNTALICETEILAAYIDGELDPAARSNLEEHLKQCADCASELKAQQLFMCELDFALAGPFEHAVPANFAQVVAVNAASDMRGVRDRTEHARALRFCIILGLGAFAFLGVASSKAVFLSARLVIDKAFGVLGFLATSIFDGAAGFTIISRVVSRGLIADSRLAGLAGLFVVAFAIVILSLLISHYHRTRVIE